MNKKSFVQILLAVAVCMVSGSNLLAHDDEDAAAPSTSAGSLWQWVLGLGGKNKGDPKAAPQLLPEDLERELPWVLDVHPTFSLGSNTQTWNPEAEVPTLQHTGATTEAERVVGETFRRGLVKNLRYWREMGLPNPPQLDGLFHFNNQNNLTVKEMIVVLNPTIPDVLGHMRIQYEALMNSELALLVRQLEARGLASQTALKMIKQGLGQTFSAEQYRIMQEQVESIEGEIQADPEVELPITNHWQDGNPSILDEFFDYYCQLRYGFAVPLMRIAVQSEMTLEQARQNMGGGAPEVDNAYFARFYKIELTELLFPAKDQDLTRAISWNRVVNVDVLKYIERNPAAGMSRRMVILPRTTQTPGDTEVSTLNDQTVGDHEQGHHINHSLADGRGLHRIVDEVLADYLAAAAQDNPKIGEFFSKAGKVIAQRLRKSPRDPQALYAALIFDRMAAQGQLRDMSEVTDLSSLPRVFFQPDDYKAGNPLRSFLWRVRQNPNIKKEDFDRVVLKTTRHFSHLPTSLSPYSWVNINLHRFFAELYLAWRLKLKTEKIMRDNPVSMDDINRKLRSDKYQKLIDSAAEELVKTAETSGKYIGLSGQDLKVRKEKDKAAYKEQVYKYLQNMEAQKHLQENQQKAQNQIAVGYSKLENRLASIRRFFEDRLRLRFFRTPITADYILANYLRTLYSDAMRANKPDLAAVIREEAEKTYNSNSMILKTDANTPVLVFTSGLQKYFPIPIARAKLEYLLSEKERLEKELMVRMHLERKVSRWTEVPEGAKDWSSPEAMAKSNELLRRYWEVLDSIQLFERKSSWFALFQPYFWIRTGEWLFSKLGGTTPADQTEQATPPLPGAIQCGRLF